MTERTGQILVIVAFVLEAIAQILRRVAGGAKARPSDLNRVRQVLDHFRDADSSPARMTFDGETLRWGDMAWPAKSGPHGKGFLPPGEYGIDWKHCAEGKGLERPYRVGDVAFWVPLVNSAEADAEGRGHFGIHPDGNVPGTAGCVGIQPAQGDAALHCRSFWERVKATRLEDRPQVLEVWQPCWVKGECPV